ncbi:hypothetical protein CK203_038237 [Vitis vinifera]|uniref:Uncharacterized protein n=1 Tax=Vitis vinifera TaxID=29760 RepID=A0A438IBI1_VITVI|nr:hypothetical protein CK203_038237 [Vitis vinifera]
MVSSAYCDQTNNEKVPPPVKAISTKMEFNRVNCLVWVLHESARSFSHTVESFELARSGPELAMAWLVPNNKLGRAEHRKPAEDKAPKIGEWFRMVELPRIAGFFIPLLKKWSMEYAGRIILAISCCVAVGKLGSGHISCPLFISSIEDALIELMNLSHSLVSMDKLHQLATEAGLQTFQDKVQESNCLATLGILAFLGRKTRLFLSGMGIKDLDEQVKDFLSYLECGSLFIYPKFSSLSMNQLFMEVVADEIGWIDFYAAFSFEFKQERRRSKPRAIQAEKEIILHTVFTVCYNVFSGFVHFSSSTQQPLNADLLAFLLRSESLLTSCLEDYWAAYNRSGYDNADFSSSQLQKIAERNAFDPTQSIGTKSTASSSLTLEAQQKASCKVGTETRTLVEAGRTVESEALHQNLLRKSSMKLISTSSDIWMGTQLLFIDIMASLELLLKQMRGRRITERERNKLKQTLVDIASLIPVTILMLLLCFKILSSFSVIQVSVIGHAAILAAIKKYVPSLISSPYSSERLDVVKQLKRSKKMEVQTPRNQEDASSAISKINGLMLTCCPLIT